MKRLIPILFLPFAVMAQSPEGQTPSPPSFDQFKQSMLPIVNKTLPSMQETRECVSKAESKEDVEKCLGEMAEKARKIQQMAGIKAKEYSTKAPEGFEWTPEKKQVMLKTMDASIQQNTVMLECLKKSNAKEEMSECMRSKMPMKGQAKKAP